MAGGGALAACAVAVLALAGGPGVAAGPVRHAAGPPADGPALDRMALAPADLPPGSVVRREGYVRDKSFSAYYVREFAPGARIGFARLSSLESDVGLAATSADAERLAAAARAALRTRSGRRGFARSALADAGWDSKGLTITFGGFRTVAAGDSASLATMTLSLPGRRRFSLVLGFVRVERALQLLDVFGSPNARIAQADVAALVGIVAQRMRAGLIPVATAAPSVSGVAQEGQVLTAEPGAWTNAPASFAVQWLRCDQAAAHCVAIDGATGTTYLLTAADVGASLEVSVVATNGAGSSPPAVSAPTTAVMPAASSRVSPLER